MDQQQGIVNQITVFYSYAHADERLRKQLETHLGLLRQQGIIATWHDRQIVPGTDWAQAIDGHLATTRVILLLISQDYLFSDYQYTVEVERAMERSKDGDAIVIPILLSPTADLESTPFGKLLALPSNRKPISKWLDKDEAFVDVARDIRAVVERLRSPNPR